MKYLLFRTNHDWTGLIIRLTTGLVLFPHGAQKMLGWFGGPGFAGEMHHLTNVAQLPSLVAVLVIFIEFFGSLSLIAGLASRIWAMAFIGLFTGIILVAHKDFGFFMNWFGHQKGEGFEYHLLIIGLSIATMVNGSGRYALDGAILKAGKPN